MLASSNTFNHGIEVQFFGLALEANPRSGLMFMTFNDELD